MSRSHQSVRGRGGELLWAICEAQSSSPDTVQPAEWLHSEGSLLGQVRHLVASEVSGLSGERGSGRITEQGAFAAVRGGAGDPFGLFAWLFVGGDICTHAVPR